MGSSCAAVVISANGQCGEDAVPLYEAGSPEIACVIALEALGQLTVSKSSGDCGGSGGSYGCVSIGEGATKVGVQAQSGQAYIVGQSIHVGKCN